MFQKCNDIDSTLFLLTNYTKKRLWHNLNKNTEKTKHVEEKLHIDFFGGEKYIFLSQYKSLRRSGGGGIKNSVSA